MQNTRLLVEIHNTHNSVTATFKIVTCTKHSANVCVPFVKSLLDNGADEGGAVEEHPLVALVVILLGHLTPSMRITFPEFDVPDLLDLGHVVSNENASGVTLQVNVNKKHVKQARVASLVARRLSVLEIGVQTLPGAN